MIKVLKKSKNYNLFLTFLFFQTFIFDSKLLSAQNQKLFNVEQKNIENSIETLQSKNDYILGIGDIISFELYGIPEFNTEAEINKDGYIFLPEIEYIYVKGLTLDELKKRLETRYSEVAFDPNVILKISEYRNISIYINGQVKRPGVYNFPVLNSGGYVKGKFPSIYDAIIRAQGTDSFADLSKIEVIRENSFSEGGGYKKTKVNFVKLITEGDIGQNILLNDGDRIKIEKSDKVLKDQILKVHKTNLGSEQIVVFVSGNVESKGVTKINRGAGLVQAITLRGGTKLLSGKVEFIRFYENGTTQRNYFTFDRNAPLNSYKNPILMDGDIINVRKTILGNASELINEVSPPLFGGYALIRLFSK